MKVLQCIAFQAQKVRLFKIQWVLGLLIKLIIVHVPRQTRAFHSKAVRIADSLYTYVLNTSRDALYWPCVHKDT